MVHILLVIKRIFNINSITENVISHIHIFITIYSLNVLFDY
jgi:hypothetical protein